MKKKKSKKTNPQQMVWIIVGIVVVCMVVIFSIVKSQEKKGIIEKQAKAVTTDMTYENAYIVSNEDNKLIFVCNGDMFCAQGTLEEKYTGIADIEIKNSKISSVSIKPDDVQGVMVSYGNGYMQVASQGNIQMQSDDIPIYDTTGEYAKQITIKDLFIGGENLAYILDSGQICAIIRRNVPDISYIRVLIKNGEEDFFPTLAISTDGKLYIDDTDANMSSIEDVAAYMNKGGYDRIKLSADVNELSVNGKKYEGYFEIQKYEQGIVAVNVLDVENYVRYVLPSEMPSGFSKEALKAQAVCARTFAYSQMMDTQYAQYGANIDNTTAYQVYNASGTYESTDEAVRETVNQVVACEGKLITCYYFSTSAGKTADMSLWSSNTPDYIKKVESIDDNSPYYRWTSQLELGKYHDNDYGNALSIAVNSSDDDGYALSVTVRFENGEKTYTTENDIRKALGKFQKSVTLSDGTVKDKLMMIPSACFSISAQADGCYTLSGGGFGHGIGMSQYGAQRLAENGASYEDIICYYYNNVSVTDITKVK